jgi:hypothetical protein
MKKLTLITTLLCLTGCSKDSETKADFPIKFMSTAFSDGYTIKSVANPQTFISDFIALPSLSEGLDKDNYECQFYNTRNLDSLLFKYNISVKPTDAREKKGTFTIYKNYVKNYNIVYYRLVRLEDGKLSETRMLNFNFR